MILFMALVVIIVLLAACAGLFWRMQEAQDQHHAKCIAHVAAFVGDEFAAAVLVAAAHDYDSAEEYSRMKVLARMKHTQGGPTMPAIWLLDRADRLRGGAMADVVTYVETTTG